MKTVPSTAAARSATSPRRVHNRWHRDIPAIVEVEEGEQVRSRVAVDLPISDVVDVPNYVVSALLPEDIFQS